MPSTLWSLDVGADSEYENKKVHRYVSLWMGILYKARLFVVPVPRNAVSGEGGCVAAYWYLLVVGTVTPLATTGWRPVDLLCVGCRAKRSRYHRHLVDQSKDFCCNWSVRGHCHLCNFCHTSRHRESDLDVDLPSLLPNILVLPRHRRRQEKLLKLQRWLVTKLIMYCLYK